MISRRGNLGAGESPIDPITQLCDRALAELRRSKLASALKPLNLVVVLQDPVAKIQGIGGQSGNLDRSEDAYAMVAAEVAAALVQLCRVRPELQGAVREYLAQHMNDG